MSETPSQQILRSPALFQERHNHVIVGSSERPPPKPKVSSFLLPAVGFVATAVFSSLGYQVLFYQGAAGEGLTMITVFPAYLGMLLLFLVPRSHLSESFAGTSEDPPDLYDLSLQAAIAQTIQSSVVIVTALLSRLILKRVISRRQWIAVIIVTLGLICSTADRSSLSLQDVSITGEGKRLGLVDHQIMGIAAAIGSTCFYALIYVGSEIVADKFKLPPRVFCLLFGVYTFAITSIYMSLYTMPNFESIVLDSVLSHNGSWPLIILLIVVLVLSSFVNSVSFFSLISSAGATTTGLLLVSRSVVVFLLSALLFCSSHHEQCLSLPKALSCFLITAGVLLFLLAPTLQGKSSEDLSNDPGHAASTA